MVNDGRCLCGLQKETSQQQLLTRCWYLLTAQAQE